MAEYVADTHSLLWYFARPKLLGPGATAAFAQVAAGQANLIVPVVVLAELIFALESKPLSADFDLVLSRLQASPNVTIADWTLARTLDLRALQAIPAPQRARPADRGRGVSAWRDAHHPRPGHHGVGPRAGGMVSAQQNGE